MPDILEKATSTCSRPTFPFYTPLNQATLQQHTRSELIVKIAERS